MMLVAGWGLDLDLELKKRLDLERRLKKKNWTGYAEDFYGESAIALRYY